MLKTMQFFTKAKIILILALPLIIISAASLIAVNQYTFVGLSSDNTPNIINKNKLLKSQFEEYKEIYVDPQFHRTVDKQRDGVTTSEGQSYTMLRSVWMDDKETFDLSWEWTQNNLQREDMLFSWLWGQRPDGSWGLIESQGGQNVATDADIDIAMALIFASNKWNDDNYVDQAKKIIDSIWEKTVVKLNGNYLLLPNDLEKISDKSYYIVNPSYFSPAHFRIFAQYDSNNNWNRLADDSYKFLTAFHDFKISKNDSPKLPPNWIGIEKSTLKIINLPSDNLNTNYGFDALRIPFRIGLDSKWFDTNDSKDYLNKFSTLVDSFAQEGAIYGEYSRDGQAVVDFETRSMYGANLPIFKQVDREGGEKIINEKILNAYNFDKYRWNESISYYDDNWSWFGLAFYLDKTPNIK